MREDILPEVVRNYYEWQGQAGDHQEQMYESGDAFERWWQNRRKTVVEALIEEHDISSLLDVGCAEGLFVRFLAEKRRLSVGLDMSQPKLRRAKAYTNALKSASFVLADGSQLPFNDSSFDMVISVDVIRYLPDPTKAVRELLRVSRKYVVLQSGTSFKWMFSSRIIPRHYEDIKKEYQSNPFAGSLWYVPSTVLINMNRCVGQGYKVAKIIGHYSALIRVPHSIFPFKDEKILSKNLVGLAERVDNFLAEKPLFNRMGTFTTVLFEKRVGER